MFDCYFDNAATTPLDPRVQEAMLPFLDEAFGNANSIHAWGLRARDAVEQAREQVATLIGAEDPSQIYFTSGATEANNWVLNAAEAVVISPFEHSAMREPAQRRGALVMANVGTTLVAQASSLSFVAGRTSVDSHSPERAGWKPALLSVMSVNNEIGSIWHAPDYAHESNLVHSDITQAVGKLPVDLSGVDFASFSAHKFYGPKGTGALYCREQPPPPLIMGGEQEHGYRGGTLNVPAIVGMGKAAEIAFEEQPDDLARAENLREILIDGLKGLSESQINGGDRTSPFIVSVSFRGIEGETLVLEMDRAGYAISSGAACSSRSTEPSHVLSALKIQPEWLRGTVRISFGRMNSKEATASFAKKMRTTVELLRTL